MSLAPLDAIKISQELSQTYPRVKVIGETTSTQTEIANLFRPLSPFDLVIAEYQTHGRGRLDRTFSAPPFTSLLFSLYVEPHVSKNFWGVAPLLIGAAVATGIRNSTGLAAYTKWPNDVLINQRKVCGILCEVNGNGIVAGVGINVNSEENDLPIPTATSLRIELQENVSRESVLIEVCGEIHSLLTQWSNGVNLSERIREYCDTIGKSIRITKMDGSYHEGDAVGITDHGELILASGETFSVGDVTHLR